MLNQTDKLNYHPEWAKVAAQ